jgi:GNAT superfamily N-acetyltransferase
VPADRDLLLELIRSYYAFDHLAFEEDRIREGLSALLADASLGRAYLLDIGAQTAGYFLFTYGFDLEFGGKLALLTDLYLASAWRRQGYGRATLQYLRELLPSLGVRSLELQVERGNTEALRLYRTFGFRELHRIPMDLLL